MRYRRYERIVIEKEVECEIEGVRDYVFLYNLSVGGCMIEVDSPTAHIGSTVSIDLAGIAEVEGRIVWRKERNAGVEFNGTIPDSIVQYLGFEISLMPFTEMRPRDRYGNLLDLAA